MRMPGFDPVFYAKYYSDLRHLGGEGALLDHYFNHGRREGRFINLREAREHFAARGSTLPPDFNPRFYAERNKHLQLAYDEPWQFELHFLGADETEKRAYVLAETKRREAGWQTVFNLYDFLLFSEEWRTPGHLSREAALALFQREGIARLTPIARDWAFDPDFYRENYALGFENPADLYRDWLENGFREDRAPNEHRAVMPYVGNKGYPPAFDWRRFAGFKLGGMATYPTKIEALEKLFERPLEPRARDSIAGDGAAELHAQIGDFHLIRDSFEIAISCYTAAGKNAQVLVRKGDALRSLGRVSEALVAYREALELPAYSIWALVHAARLSVETGDHRAAFDLLAAARTRWAGDPAYRGTIDDCLELRFRQITDATRKLIAGGDVGAANDFADREFQALTKIIETMKRFEPFAVRRDPRRVVMLASLDLPQCTHYRVRQKIEQLALFGIDLEVFDLNDPGRFMTALPGAAAALFYRVPCYPRIIESILYARALGIVTYYDIDDLVFSQDFPDDFESYEGQISYDVFIGLRHGVALYRHAITLCDVALASTRPLADRMSALVRTGTAHVVANALDTANETVVALAERPRPAGKAVNIFYGSGTRAHNRDFNVVVGPALLHLLKTHADITLTIVGYLGLGPGFEPFEDRIFRFPFIDSRPQYCSLLAACDINMSVLHPSAVVDCKSEIKWLEAAILEIPSVVSRTATFELILDAPNDGLIAGDTRDWIDHLSRLVADPGLRQGIGVAARKKALRLYAPKKIGRDLVAALAPHVAIAGRAAVERRDRGTTLPRVLICHVFFAPQTHGGATRVVEANVDYFIDKYASKFEISILTTDDRMTPGSFRVDTYRGCGVFRIATPLERNMDWRPFNEDNAPFFQRVLDMVRPSLVHFHCIQRLTATIVEETRRREIPYVVTVHDAWWISDHQFLVDQNDMLVPVDGPLLDATLPEGVTRLQSVDRRQRLGGLLNGARFVLPVSSAFGTIHRNAGIQNVRPIANGMGKLPAALPSRTNPEKLVLGHFGSRSVHKGAALIEAILRRNSFENLELVMVDATVEFGHEIHVVWGGTSVFLRGNCPQARVNELYASIDVLLAPSIWPESFGLVAREAAFYGKWVVASNLGAMAEDVREGEDGFVIDVSTSHGLEAVLLRMNEAPRRYKSVPRRSDLRSADRQAEELAALYLSLIGDQRHGEAVAADGKVSAG